MWNCTCLRHQRTKGEAREGRSPVVELNTLTLCDFDWKFKLTKVVRRSSVRGKTDQKRNKMKAKNTQICAVDNSINYPTARDDVNMTNRN